jgi:organic radical activating enzyme
MLGEILSEVRSRGSTHVVVTGGEPMIFDKVVDLTQGLKQLGLHITIETAGTVYKKVACDLMSISPKLANSTPHERDGGKWAAQHDRLRYQPKVLRKLMREYEYQLKFVVSAPGDIQEIETIVGETRADPAKVILMPEGTTAAAIRERSAWIVELCKRNATASARACTSTCGAMSGAVALGALSESRSPLDCWRGHPSVVGAHGSREPSSHGQSRFRNSIPAAEQIRSLKPRAPQFPVIAKRFVNGNGVRVPHQVHIIGNPAEHVRDRVTVACASALMRSSPGETARLRKAHHHAARIGLTSDVLFQLLLDRGHR